MRPGPSIRFRLVVGIVLVLAVGGVAVALAALAYGRSAAQQSYDRLLVGAARQIARAISLRDGEVVVDLPVSAFELLSLAPRDRVVYGVFDQEGRLITGYGSIAPPADGSAFFNGSFAGEPARFAHVARPFAERAFTGSVSVVIGQTLQARRELARQITRNALIAVAVIGAVMAALAMLAVRAALRPLHRIERDFAARSSKDLTPVDLDVPQEISSLVRALNRFIARIDRQLQIMHRLIADAAHQLRTPIAALRAQAELAADETDPERQRNIVGRIHERSKNLSRLADQLLSHALIIHRADSVDLEELDLRRVATEAVAEADQGLDEAHLALHLDLPEAPVPCRGDALSLIEACKNLINNALGHGRPPITLRVRAADGRAVIAVHDRGAGFPEEMWADAGTRFASTAGVSARSAGLGLAIVAAVARAHGGQLQIRRPAEGGFEVAIALPAGSSEARP